VKAAKYGKRIVGYGEVPAGELLANPQNWRIHPEAQQTALNDVLSTIGFVQSVIVNKRSSDEWGAQDRGVETMVDGHLRAQLALSRGEETPVPVVYVDLTPEEERRVLMTFDPIAAMAATDKEKLDELIAESAGDFPESTLDLDAILKGEKKQRVSFDASTATNVIVECGNIEEQEEIINELTKRGYKCAATSRALKP
jgi:ParB-like chromosome segregation protein Spo0J